MSFCRCRNKEQEIVNHIWHVDKTDHAFCNASLLRDVAVYDQLPANRLHSYKPCLCFHFSGYLLPHVLMSFIVLNSR